MDNLQPLSISQLLAPATNYNDLPTGQWDPGFDAERCVVLSQLGPYQKLFERPYQFTKRFYHILYPLPIEHWHIHDQVSLYDGFCTIDVDLTIHFQATIHYVTRNEVEFENLNANIKMAYDELVWNIVQTHLLSLEDARWVQTGLARIEHAIALAVSELFLVHDLQAMTICALDSVFKDFPELKFREEAAYLMVLKKSFEMASEKKQAEFLHEQYLEQLRQEQERQRLDNLHVTHELALLKQAQDAEHQKKTLLDQEIQQLERFAVERRLHGDKVSHEALMNELSLGGQYQLREKQELLERQLAERSIDEKIALDIKIKEKELAAKIKLYEHEKKHWNKAKDQTSFHEIKQRQRQKQLQINADIENKAYLYRQQLLLEDQLAREKAYFLAQSGVNENQAGETPGVG